MADITNFWLFTVPGQPMHFTCNLATFAKPKKHQYWALFKSFPFQLPWSAHTYKFQWFNLSESF